MLDGQIDRLGTHREGPLFLSTGTVHISVMQLCAFHVFNVTKNLFNLQIANLKGTT